MLTDLFSRLCVSRQRYHESGRTYLWDQIYAFGLLITSVHSGASRFTRPDFNRELNPQGKHHVSWHAHQPILMFTTPKPELTAANSVTGNDLTPESHRMAASAPAPNRGSDRVPSSRAQWCARDGALSCGEDTARLTPCPAHALFPSFHLAQNPAASSAHPSASGCRHGGRRGDASCPRGPQAPSLLLATPPARRGPR